MQLADSWGKVTIRQFLERETIIKTISDPIERGMHVIATMGNVDYKEVEKLTPIEVIQHQKKLSFLDTTLPSERLPLEFELNGVPYKAIIYQSELEGNQLMKGGQFGDYWGVCNRANAGKPEDAIYEMHNFLACFCVAGKKEKGQPFFKYRGYTREANNFYENMTMDIAYPFYVFFLNVWKNFSAITEASFRNQSRKNLKMLRQMMRSRTKEIGS